jgi:hypothetical protein
MLEKIDRVTIDQLKQKSADFSINFADDLNRENCWKWAGGMSVRQITSIPQKTSTLREVCRKYGIADGTHKERGSDVSECMPVTHSGIGSYVSRVDDAINYYRDATGVISVIGVTPYGNNIYKVNFF